jgi:hypothetical protein
MTTRKIKKYISICLVILIIGSCTPMYHYFPSFSSVPDFRSNNELQINGTFGDLSKSINLRDPLSGPFCFDLQMGYSITNNIFVNLQSQYNTQIKPTPIRFFESNINANTVEDHILYKTNGINLGWLKWHNNFLWGIKTGINLGKIELDFINKNEPSSEVIDFYAKYYNFSLAPFGVYEVDYCQIAFQINLVRANYSNIDNRLNLLDDKSNYNPFVPINKPFNGYYVEPSITIKAGSKNAKIVFQEIKSFNLGNKNLYNMKFNSYIGFELKFDINKIANFIQSKKK